MDTGATIRQSEFGDFSGRWFVFKQSTDKSDQFGNRLVAGNLYLWNDGTWRAMTTDDGKPTGYFATEADARACLERAEALGASQGGVQ